ncbi:MAG: BatA domain-containing protein [Nitrospirae bacterium]|nr:BatA domain-containing protein [Nitrospirota bacterium]
MDLLQPGLLPFLGLMAVPPIIHLLTRLRARRQPFPPIALVLRLQKSTARIQRLKEALLLAVRCLVIAGLVGTLAGPYLKRASAGGGANPTDRPVAVIIDNSASMLMEINRASLLDSARKWVKSLVRSGSKVAYVGVLGDAGGGLGVRTVDGMELERFVDRLRPFYGAVNAVEGIQRAMAALPEGGTIVVLSDLRRSSWDAERPRPIELPPGIRVEVRDLSVGREVANSGVRGVARQARSGPGEWELAVTAEVAADGNEHEVTLKESSGDARRVRLEAAGGGMITVPVPVAPAAGARFLTGEARLEADAFPADDARYFVFPVSRPLRVTVIEGEFGSVPLENETFYLSKAFLKFPSGVEPMEALVLRPGLLRDAPSTDPDVTLLVNVKASDLPSEWVHGLVRSVKKGAGLIIFSGKNVIEKDYNELMGDILPGHVADVRSVDPVPGRDDLRIGSVEWDHPIMQPFAGGAQGDPDTIRVRQYTRFRLAPGAGTVVASLENGDPYVVVGRAGAGRVVFFTSTADRDWNDFPVHPVFVPIVQQACSFVAARAESAGTMIAEAGKSVRLNWPGSPTRSLRAGAPDGREWTLQVSASQGQEEIEFMTPGPPGLYTIEDPDEPGGLRVTVAANTAMAETDLARITPDEMAGIVKGNVQIQSAPHKGTVVSVLEDRWDATNLALAFLVLLVAGELFLGNPRG